MLRLPMTRETSQSGAVLIIWLPCRPPAGLDHGIGPTCTWTCKIERNNTRLILTHGEGRARHLFLLVIFGFSNSLDEDARLAAD